MKFGCCSDLTNAALLKSLGFDYIELAVSRDLQPLEGTVSPVFDIKEALEAAGIPVEAFNLLLPPSLKVTGASRSPSLLIEYMTRACYRAAEFGASTLVFGSGGARMVPDGFEFRTAQEQIIEFLQTVADLAKTNGLMIVIEPLQKAECNIINSVSDAVEIATVVARADAVSVLSDLYHVTQDGQPFSQTADAGTILQHVHVACGADRHPPTWNDAGELIRYFAEVKKAGYDGRISIEADFIDFEPQAQCALEVLNHAWSAADESSG
jgi:sugar phosphate isomerase/epimerase